MISRPSSSASHSHVAAPGELQPSASIFSAHSPSSPPIASNSKRQSQFPGLEEQQQGQAEAIAQQRASQGHSSRSALLISDSPQQREALQVTATDANAGMSGDFDLGPGWSSRTPTRPVQPLAFAGDPSASAPTSARVALSSASARPPNGARGQAPFLPGAAGPSTQPADIGRERAGSRAGQAALVLTDQMEARRGHLRDPSKANTKPALGKADPSVAEVDFAQRRDSNEDSNAEGSTPAASGSAAQLDKDAQARKQNSACDACRNRKVRCNRAPGEDKCQHCKSKGIECTTIYVQLATTGVKRPAKRPRGEGQDGPSEIAQHVSEESFYVVRYLLLRDVEYGNQVQGLSFPEQSRRRAPTTAAEARLNNATARQEFVSSLLETYFSTVHIRYPILDPHEFLQRFHYQSAELGGPPSDPLVAVLLAWGAKFSTHPIILADRKEAATEELSPTQRQKRHEAHGAIASERAARPASRASSEASNEFVRSIGRSRIAEELIVKAQEVLDRNKVHRIATMDNSKAALIIQALFWQQASDTENHDATLPDQLRARARRGVYICNGVWVNCAISHMFEMKVHLKEIVMGIEDESQRGQIAMTWWLACMFDAHMSAFYRRKPLLSTEDYSTEPPSPPASAPSGQAGPQPTAAESGFRIWLESALDQVEMMRSVYFTLFTPRAAQDGVSARKLENLASMAYRWRSNHLKNVGAPDPDWPVHWKFVDAVTACSSDINYQIVWILMWQAVDEFGIAELKASNLNAYNLACMRHGTRSGLPSTSAEMELDQSKIGGLRSAIYDEALKASLRCAHLAGMLCDFDYLQHEAGIMKFALCEAGYCLTRFRRPEVHNIIKGLRQYGQAFEECYDQANELERLAGEPGEDASSGLGLVDSGSAQARERGAHHAQPGVQGNTSYASGKVAAPSAGGPRGDVRTFAGGAPGRHGQSGSAGEVYGEGVGSFPGGLQQASNAYAPGYFENQGQQGNFAGPRQANVVPSGLPHQPMSGPSMHQQPPQHAGHFSDHMNQQQMMYSPDVPAGYIGDGGVNYGGNLPQSYSGQGASALGAPSNANFY